MQTTLAERLSQLWSKIEEAAKSAGRSPDSITLLAVSKTHPPELIRECVHAGCTLFGESRVQEARAKIQESPARARWHFIGHLQRNKVRQALPLFELFHGIDSLSIAEDIQRIAEEDGQRPAVLLEVNVAGEGSKFGFRPENLRGEIDRILSLDRLEIRGLMAIPPFAPKPEASRAYFVKLRELRESLQNEFSIGLPELSMGMSGDFEVAIQEGATIVRIGTALFGERASSAWRPGAPDS